MTPLLSKQAGLAMLLLVSTAFLKAQTPQLPFPTETEMLPLDDITQRSVLDERALLHPADVREADLLWEKTVWRVIDTREKMNLPFVYPEAPLFTILTDGIRSGELPAYAEENGRLARRLDPLALMDKLVEQETLYVFNLDKQVDELKVVENEFNWEDVRRFRVKETWFFDSRTGALHVRILGLAPMRELYTDNGDYLGEEVMFWVYVPQARELLNRHTVYVPGGDKNARLSWADWLDMHYFEGHIVKEDNVYGRRLQDYLAGVELLQESDRIQQGIFNREQDAWSR